MRCLAGLAALLLVLVVAVASGQRTLPTQPLNPIMGILTDPAGECGYPAPSSDMTQCMESFYVRWLATAGIRVVPIPWNTTKAKRDALMMKTNGILFPGGGGLSIKTFDAYFNVVEDIVNTTIQWNEAGDHFVVWGTCMGFQVVNAAVGGDMNIIKGGFVGVDPKMLPLDFTSAQPSSVMYGNATCPADILNTLQYQNSTLNWHAAGIPPETYTTNARMAKYLSLTSTNVDGNGRAFASSAEGKNGLAIYSTQYHPERPPYEYTSDVIGHTVDDIRVSQYLARFVKEKLQGNTHSFSSPEEAEQHSVHNYQIKNYGLGYELYWMPNLDDISSEMREEL